MKIMKIYFLLLVLLVSMSAANVPGNTIATNIDKYIGLPYIWGGTDIATGVDSSGLIQTLYRQQGFGLSRTAHEQATRTDECPTVSSLAQTTIGDTIYFKNDEGNIHHVAIITGFKGSRPIITHAKGKKHGVIKEIISDRYISETYMIKRYSECKATYTEPKDYLLIAYILATGVSEEQLNNSRENDLDYNYMDPFCCCNDAILELFKNHTSAIAKRINPATDNIIKTLSQNLEINDLKIKKLINLKYANSIYSFYDINESAQPQSLPTFKKGGCVPLDFNKKSDKDYYLALLGKFENGGKYDTHSANSSAYGKYQFATATGSQYCKRVGDDCCAHWHTASQKGMECQDRMFIEFTKDNTDFLDGKSFNINTCSVYLSHQLGVSSYLWLKGSKNPYSSFTAFKNTISNNVSGTYRDRAQLASSEKELRQIYGQYWSNEKFGGDIFADIGKNATLPELTTASHKLNNKPIDIALWYREGILLQLLEIIKSWKFIFESSSQKSQTEMIQ